MYLYPVYILQDVSVSFIHYTGCITWPVYCTAIGGSSGDVIRTIHTIRNNICNYIYIKCKNKKYIRSKFEILRLLWDIEYVFRLVVYLLNMICLILQLLYKIWYIYTFWFNFDTVLYQLLETWTSDRCLICIVQRLRFSGFNPLPTFIFPLQSI